MADGAYDLRRFTGAQEGVFDRAMVELRGGRKRTHWMWFVFPQLRGLGQSPTAQFYGIGGLEEAYAYLAHEVLGSRLQMAAQAAGGAPAASLRALFGAPDDLKFCSSMTLFAIADPKGPYKPALDSWGATPDPMTLALVSAWRPA